MLVSFLTSYIAGLISFIAPCLLPLLPSYFSAISGVTFQELYGLSERHIRSRIIGNSFLFVSGFALVYTILGATGSIVGIFMQANLSLLLRIGGIIMIFFGLSQLGVIHTSFLKFDYAWNVQKKLTHLGFFSSFATGIVAAISWIPCISVTLTPILLLASSKTTVWEGSLLLFIFSLGIGTPFIIAGLLFPSVYPRIQSNRRLFHGISTIAASITLLFGILLVSGKYQLVVRMVQRVFASYFQ
ncbi:sulfite exporter TauE/SafE family protein [Candidatus Gottesmanbacteria bacterium]|nr:sulfite exporter TauE/SafE family protein [Candidatus Gottesmanbacteria bacterium]